MIEDSVILRIFIFLFGNFGGRMLCNATFWHCSIFVSVYWGPGITSRLDEAQMSCCL